MAEIEFKNFVVGLFESQLVIRLAGAVIVGFDVEPQIWHVAFLPSQLADMLKERPEDARAAMGFGNVDALNPPNVSVAPVAPLVGDQELPGEGAVDFGNVIDAPGGMIQQRRNTGQDAGRLKLEGLGFHGQAPVEIGDDLRVRGDGFSDLRFHRAEIKSNRTQIKAFSLPGPGAHYGDESLPPSAGRPATPISVKRRRRVPI